MAYDAESDRVVLFGGWAGGETGETWVYDYNTNTWTKKNPAAGPAPRDAHAMAYDVQSKRVILFGGFTATGPIGDTWAYDLNSDTWTLMAPSVSPPARIGARMVYLRSTDRIILFGGHNGEVYSDTWAYNFDANTWTEITPTTGPSPRAWQAMAYDAQSQRIVLFGGDRALAVLGDTWIYDGVSNSWVQMNPSQSPSARSHGRAAYDSGSDAIVMFGGNNGSSETWTYDLDTDAWLRKDVAIRPSERIAHAMVYDEESDRIVLFGGSWPPLSVSDPAITHTNETWAYDIDTNAWTRLIEPPPQDSGLTVGLLVAAGIVGVGVAAVVLWRRRKKS